MTHFSRGGGKTSFQNLREYEEQTNFGFDSVIFSSFALILLSAAIIQHKYFKQKKQLELLLEHEKAQKSFSRELHDTVAQSLSALKVAVKSGEKEKALFWADKSILETRELISSLRTDLKEDFVFLVKDYAQTFENNFCIKTCVFDATNFAENFDEKTKSELFRILQESLSNIAKHSKATKAEIKLLDSGNDFIMSISDNGIGFDYAQPKVFDTERVRDSSTCEAVPKFRRFLSEAENRLNEGMSRARRRSANSPTQRWLKPAKPPLRNAQKQKNHIGLKSMEERARILDAEFSVKSAENGTTVLVKMKMQ